MDRNYENVIKSINHLRELHKTFLIKDNYSSEKDFEVYLENTKKLAKLFSQPEVEIYKQLYREKSRQMILADILEYILLSRGLFFLTDGTTKHEKKQLKKKLFIKSILYFVNLLMSYESMTVDDKIRKRFLENLAKSIPELKKESKYEELLNFKGKVGLTQKESDASEDLNKYFDSILPKTAGGLWHELLVFIFLIRYDLGYVVPLLLSQKFISANSVLVPPDFLIITKDKDVYGIEVGIKKEI